MKIFILQIIVYCLAIIIGTDVLAASNAGGIGNLAKNLLEPVNLFSNLVQAGCFVIGGSFLFASIVKYFEHKRSPLMTPLSTVVFLFIFGVALLAIPFISYFLGSNQ